MAALDYEEYLRRKNQWYQAQTEMRAAAQKEYNAAMQRTSGETARIKAGQQMKSAMDAEPKDPFAKTTAEKMRSAAAVALRKEAGLAPPEPRPNIVKALATGYRLGEGMHDYYDAYGIKRASGGVGGEEKLQEGMTKIEANKAAADWGHKWAEDMESMGLADKAKEYLKAALDPQGTAIDITMSLPAMLDIAKYQLGAGAAANLAALVGTFTAGPAGTIAGGATHGAGIAAATYMEADDEANAVYEEIFNEEIAAGKTPQEAHAKAKPMSDEASRKNLAILGATNALEQVTMFGGYASAAGKAAKAAGKTAKDAGRIARLGEKIDDIKALTGVTQVQDKLADMGKLGKAIEVGGRFGIGVASEGTQEGLQYIASQTSMDKPWEFGTEFAQNVFAGAAMGGGTNIAGQAVNIASRLGADKIKGKLASQAAAETTPVPFPNISNYGAEANEQAQQAFVAGLPEEIKTQLRNDIETLVEAGLETQAATQRALDNLLAANEEFRAVADQVVGQVVEGQVRQALAQPESRNQIIASLPQETQAQLVDIARGFEEGTLDTQEKVEQAVEYMLEDPAVVEAAQGFLQQRTANVAVAAETRAKQEPAEPQSPGAARYTAPAEEPVVESEVAPPAPEALSPAPEAAVEQPGMQPPEGAVPPLPALTPTQGRQAAIDSTPALASRGVKLVEGNGPREKRIRALAAQLGLEVEFFDANNKSTAEFVMPSDPGVIYVRRGGIKQDGRPEMWALGHGFVHALKQQRPELYEQLAQVVADTVTVEQIKKYLSEFTPERQAEILSTPGLLLEEIIADEGGNFFLQIETWQAVNGSDATLFDKLVAFMREFLASLQGGPKRVENHLNELQIKRFAEAFENVINQVTQADAEAQATAEKAHLEQQVKRYNELIEEEIKWLKDQNWGSVSYMPDEYGTVQRASLNQQWYRDFLNTHGRAPRKGEWREMAINNLIRGNERSSSDQDPEFLGILSELSRGKKLSPEWKALQETIRVAEGQPELADLVADMKAEQARVEPTIGERDFERLNEVEEKFRRRMADRPDMGQYGDVAFSERRPYNERIAGRKNKASKGLQHLGQKRGGFTYDALNKAIVTEGVAVSPYPQYERILSGTEFTIEAIDQYLIDNAEYLAKPDHKFGLWYNGDNDSYYLDISILADTREEATKVALEHNQLAVYDLGKGEEISVQTEDERARREKADRDGDGERGESEGSGSATGTDGQSRRGFETLQRGGEIWEVLGGGPQARGANASGEENGRPLDARRDVRRGNQRPTDQLVVRLQGDIADRLEAKGISVTPIEDVNPVLFFNAFKRAKVQLKRGAFVDLHTIAEYKDMKTFLTPGGYSGIAVEKNGNGNSFFHNAEKSGMRQASVQLILRALSAGLTKMDCYHGKNKYNLSAIYEQYGFVPVARVKWDDQRPALDGGEKPDIIFFGHNGDSVTEVADKIGTYPEHDYDALPVTDYEQAERLRDSWLKEDRGGPKFSDRQAAPTFFSQLRKTIEEKMPDKMQPGSLVNLLNKFGVKREEMEWAGIKEWLVTKKDRVSKEEVLDFLAKSDVEIKEVDKTEKPVEPIPEPQLDVETKDRLDTEQRAKISEARSLYNELTGDWRYAHDFLRVSVGAMLDDTEQRMMENDPSLTPEVISLSPQYKLLGTMLKEIKGLDDQLVELFDEYDDAMREWRRQQREAEWNTPEGPRYSQFSLAPGENYHEVLLIMAPKNPGYKVVKNGDGEFNIQDPDGALVANVIKRAPATWTTQKDAERHVESLLSKDQYRSPHWDEGNVLAWVRLDSRVGADGKKVLFIEEIQSDWHQAGSEEGYSDPGAREKLRGLIVRTNELGNRVRDLKAIKRSGDLSEQDELELESSKTEYIKVRSEANLLRDKIGDIPDAPLKGTWQQFAMKRMIRYAAENGFDRLAWTTGEQQFQRWGSEKFEWIRHPKGKKHGWIVSFNEQFRGDVGGINIEQEARERGELLESSGIPIETQGHLYQVIRENTREHGRKGDLKAKRLADKAWARMQKEDAGTYLPRYEGMKSFYDDKLGGFLNKYVKKWGAKVEEALIGEDLRNTSAYKKGGLEEVKRIARERPPSGMTFQPSIAITDAMRESVLYEGQPLFSDRKNPDMGKGWLRRGNITTVLEGAFDQVHKSLVELQTYPSGAGTYRRESIKSWEEEAQRRVAADREKAILEATDPEMKVKDVPVRLAMALQLVEMFGAEAKAAEAAGNFAAAQELWAKAADINFKAAAMFTKVGQGAASGLLWASQDSASLVNNAYHRAKKVYDNLPTKTREKFEKATHDGQQEMDRINGDAIDGVLDFEDIGDAIKDAAKKAGESRQQQKKRKAKVQKAPPEILAAMIRRYVADPEVKDTEEDPIKTMLRTLMEVAKEVIPKEVAPKAEPLSPIDILRAAMMNREKYRDVWAQAQEIFKQKYGLEFDGIEEFLAHYLSTPYAQNKIDLAAAKAIKDLELNILDAVAGGTLGQLKEQVIAALDNVPYLGPRRGGLLNQRIAEAIDRLAEQARDRAAKSLAKRVEKMATEQEAGKPSPANDMMTTLMKIVKKTMKEKGKPKPRNPMEVIAEAMMNRETYKEIWLQAHAELFDQYENDPKFKDLDKFFRSNTYMGYTAEQLNAGVSYGIKALDIQIKELIREHYSKTNVAGMTLATKLMEGLDLDPGHAVALESRIRAALDERTRKAKEQVLENLVKNQVRRQDRKYFVQKMVELSNLGAFGTEFYRNAMAKEMGIPVIDEEAGAEIMRLADLIQTAEGPVREEAMAQLNAFMSNLQEPGFLRKVSSFQTMMMLLNPKTNIRNIAGNELIYRADRISKYLGTPIDIARSALTGTERAVTFRTGDMGKGAFWSGFAKGWHYGWRGWIAKDITSQFDLQHGLSFRWRDDPAQNFVDFTKKWVNNVVLSGGERMLRATLQGFDYAAYNRAYNETMGELACLACINNKEELTKENIHKHMETLNIVAEQTAQEYGKYLTFQDDNVISDALVKTKGALNRGLNWGPGDWILKFPRTAGGLLMRGLEYSPLGVIRCAKYAYLAFGPEPKVENQRQLSLAVSRMLVGSFGITAFGAKMAALGLIYGAGEDDQDFESFARSQGLRTTGFNATGLRRWIFSGFDASQAQPQKNDLFITYDWAEPLAMSVAMGVSMSKGAEVSKTDVAHGVLIGLAGAINSVVEQPLLKGIQNWVAPSYGGDQTQHILRALGSLLSGIPASFMPSMLNLVRQDVDNVRRYTKGTGGLDVTEETLNLMKNKVPWLSKTLPAAIDGFGREALLQNTKPKGIAKFFHVYFNPAYVSRYNPTPEAKLALEIYQATGATKHFPNPVPTSININEQKILLSGKDRMMLQRELGRLISLGYLSMPDSWSKDKQAKEMVSYMSDAWTTVRDVYLVRNRPQELTESIINKEMQKAKEAQ